MTPRTDAALAGALLGLWCAAAIWLRWGAWAPDLSAVIIAARLWAEGGRDLVYAAPEGFFGGAPEGWAAAMEALGIAGRESFAYVYPPLWLALLAPLVQGMPVQAAMDAATLVQVPLLAASVVLAGRLARPDGWSWTRWALWGVAVLSLTVPATHALMHNQPTITMGFLILLAAERQAAGRPVAAGLALALAAAIKLTPAAFVLLFLLPGARRALGAFALAGLALAGMSVLLAGWQAHLDFLAALGAVSGVSLMIAINLSLESALVTLGGLTGLWPLPSALPAGIVAPVLAGVLARLIGLALLAALLWRWRGHARAPLALLLGLAVIVPLAGPLGWLHYYVLPLLLLPALLTLAPQARVLLALVPLALSLPLFLALRTLPGFDLGFVVVGAALWLAVLATLLRRGA